MYLPRHFALDDDSAVDEVLAQVSTVELVTFDGVRPVATLMPMLWERAADPTDSVRGRLLGHLARANDQWSTVAPGSLALAIATGPEGYVSPSWYPSKAEHGRVVPTWNYVSVHLTGALVVRHDPDWLRGVVGRLTRRHEQHRPAPWTVQDAPDRFIERSLHAIVGIELVVTSIEAKAKLSQNRDRADADGVVRGLRADDTPSSTALAEAVQRAMPLP